MILQLVSSCQLVSNFVLDILNVVRPIPSLSLTKQTSRWIPRASVKFAQLEWPHVCVCSANPIFNPMPRLVIMPAITNKEMSCGQRIAAGGRA